MKSQALWPVVLAASGVRYPLAISYDGDISENDEGTIRAAATNRQHQSDARLAASLAYQAGIRLESLKANQSDLHSPWSLGHEADELSNAYILQQLAVGRPSDAVMSEEAPDDRQRLTADRCWIVDPLDGSSDYPYPDSMEWAVHVALVQQHKAIAAAVSVPGLQEVFATDTVQPPGETARKRPFIISSRSNSGVAAAVADDLGADVAACGSAGVKAMLVVNGTVDLYVHASGLWEWDVCAPAAVAAAAGLVVSDLDGNELQYNKPKPTVRGFVVSRPEFAEQTHRSLERLQNR